MPHDNPLDRINRAITRGGVTAAAAAMLLVAANDALACYGLTCAPNTCATFGTAMTHAGPGGLGQPEDPNNVVDWGNASRNMILQSQMPLSAIGGGTAGASLYGWVDPLTNKEYAIMGRNNGTAIVDITNPKQPKYVANIPSAGSNTSWREPKVYQNYVYVGVDGGTHPLQYADLTQVRNYVGTTLNLNYSTFTASVGGGSITNIHTLAINKDSGYLYLSGTGRNNGAPLMIDVRNPATPVVAGNGLVTSLDGYSHETQVVTYHGPDAQYQGRELILSSNGKQSGVDTFSIIDVTNKSATTRIKSVTYPNAGYTHQGWLTEDQRYFFMDDELDETGGQTGGHTRTHLWDLADLDNPVYKGYWDQATTSIDHNLYVKDGFVFETNYTTGLHMFKIGDLANGPNSEWIHEVAYFDTYLPNDGATFNGAWNNYPFFPSGNIPISDINGGLFVVRPLVKGWAGYHGPSPSDVPEPATAGMLLTGIALACSRRNRK